MFESIPEAWQRRTLASLASYENGFGFNESYWSNQGLPIIRIAQITGSQGVVDYYSGNLPATFRIRDEDLIFSWSGTLAVVRWLGGPAWLNQHLFKVVPSSDIDRSFLFHVLQSSVAEMDKRAHGSTMKHIKRGELKEFSVCVPEAKTEQRTIARILDSLDTAIQQTEAILEKLKAVKQGLLHDLLTRGIDANGQLRPPQAEAPHLYKESPLGWIPKEWEGMPLSGISTLITSGSRDWARYYSDEGALFVRIGNLTREHVNLRFDSVVFVKPPEGGDGQRTRLECDDVLISITADLGIVGIVPSSLGEAYINQHIALVRLDTSAVNPRFVGHFLASPRSQDVIRSMNDAGAKSGLNLPAIRGLISLIPKRIEQDRICIQLDEIDGRISTTKSEQAKFRSLKIALMDDLLTGRVRVTPLLEKAA